MSQEEENKVMLSFYNGFRFAMLMFVIAGVLAWLAMSWS